MTIFRDLTADDPDREKRRAGAFYWIALSNSFGENALVLQKRPTSPGSRELGADGRSTVYFTRAGER